MHCKARILHWEQLFEKGDGQSKKIIFDNTREHRLYKKTHKCRIPRLAAFVLCLHPITYLKHVRQSIDDSFFNMETRLSSIVNREYKKY